MSIILDIEKKLGKFRLEVSLQAGNETLALLGASGCGKSMTLRCIAGIERPDRGHIEVDGRVLFDSEKKINLPPQQRHTGLMFQNYALFPNMTVEQNVAAGMHSEKDRDRRNRAVKEILQRFGLSELADHTPAQLSGGQQQRTALARILISSPEVLMLDEPFSALDSHLRFQMEEEVRNVIRSFGKTVLLVSHDREEVFRMSDRIAVMKDGRVEVCGEKNAVFTDPKTRNAAILTGCRNISPLQKLGENRILARDWGLTLQTGSPVGNAAYVALRSHEIQPGPGENQALCRVVEEIENPFSWTLMLQAEGENILPFALDLKKEQWSAGQSPTITVHIPSSSVLLLRGAK